MASAKNGTLYTGVTNNVFKRAAQHKLEDNTSFTGKYKINRLVYYEIFDNILDAIKREKRLKKWNRAWKLRLIEELNPNWYDLVEKEDEIGEPVKFNKV